MFKPTAPKTPKFIHPAARPKHLKFQPNNHGSLHKIEDQPFKIAKVQPESPRPPEMLRGFKIHGGQSLNSVDIALHEILISYAYENDKEMSQESYRISTKALVRFIGPNVSRDDLLSSVAKLRHLMIDFVDSDDPDRRFEDVNLLSLWREFSKTDEYLAYTWTPPIRQLMRRMPSYAYLELSAIGDGGMSLKHSPTLYKLLLSHTIGKEWTPGEMNEVVVPFSPQQLAQLIGFPGHDNPEKLNVGKLNDFVRNSVEYLKRVNRFKTSVEIIPESGRGRRTHSYDFTLKLSPPDFRHVAIRNDYSIKEIFRKGGADDPKFIVRSDMWDRAKFLDVGRYNYGFVNINFHHHYAFELWKIALNEALSEKPLTDGYYTRSFRGEGLLAAIEARDASFAAWGLLTEEAEDFDLIDFLADSKTNRSAIRIEAEVARRQRLNWKTSTLESRALKSRKLAEDAKNRPSAAEQAEQYKIELEERIAAFEASRAVDEAVDAAFAGEADVRYPDQFTLIANDEDADFYAEIDPILSSYRSGKNRVLHIDDPDVEYKIRISDEQIPQFIEQISKFYTVNF